MTVWRAGHVWQVSIYRAGFTMAERLNPDCVTTVSIPEDRARLLGTNRELLREVVSMAMDLSDGIVGARTV